MSLASHFESDFLCFLWFLGKQQSDPWTVSSFEFWWHAEIARFGTIMPVQRPEPKAK